MRLRVSASRTIAAMLAAAGAAVSLQAQTTTSVGSQPPPAPPPPVMVPGYPHPVYVVPVQPRDGRTPRQRCLDEEAARIGGTLSELDRRTIDLKCSQR